MNLKLFKDKEVIFESDKSGLRPLVECILANKETDCKIYDKVIGLAAAKLIVYSEMITEIQTDLISQPAKEYLEGKIKFTAKQTVKNILTKDKDDICPMEKEALNKTEEEFFDYCLKVMKIDDYYDQIAEGYEELHREEQENKIRLIKEHLKVKKNQKLLDVGCGTGLTTEPWSCKRYGIDPAKKLLEKATNNYPDIEFKLAQAENIPYEDNFFDIVISITAIQNFDDIEKGLQEINRVGNNKFVLTFLKKSSKADEIDKLIRKIFKVKKLIIEEKDFIYII